MLIAYNTEMSIIAPYFLNCCYIQGGEFIVENGRTNVSVIFPAERWFRYLFDLYRGKTERNKFVEHPNRFTLEFNTD